jgi:hypothetical protein
MRFFASGFFHESVSVSTFLTTKLSLASVGKLISQKSLGPLQISLEMAHYVVCPEKK